MSAGLRPFGRLAALCLWLAGISSGQQLTRDFFDNTVIHDVRLDMDAGDWAALKLNYLDDTYYVANLSSGGLTAGSVGIRSRGRGSRSPEKPNLDVNVDKYVKKQTFAGIGFFILKANNQDASLMHEAVAFALYRKMGLPAPREAPARLFINGEYFGFYTLVEREDEDFLDRNLGEDKGDLFEWKPNATYNFEYLGADPAPYASLLDPKTNEDTPDYGKFIALVEAINYAPDSSFVDDVSRYLDLRLYLTLVATENAIGEIDGLWDSVFGTNNIYLYRFQDQDLFQFLPWDKDLTFWQIGRPLPLPVNNPLARRLLGIPEYRTFYFSQLAKAADLLGGAGGWADQEVNRINTLIHDAAVNDPHKQCIDLGSGKPPAPCGSSTFEQGVRDMHSFISSRAAFIRSALTQQRYVAPSGGPVVQMVSLGGQNGGAEVAPGAIVTVSGVNFGADTVATGGKTLPRSAGRSFVAVEGVRAPILAISGTGVVVQIPWDLPVGRAAVAVAAAGELSNTADAPVRAAAPEIFAVVHADGTPVNRDNPARAGEVVTLYATGLGAVDGSLASGQPAPLTSLLHTIESPVLALGPEPVTVLFAGLSPGSVGLYQINVALPGNLPSGDEMQLSVSTDGKTAEIMIPIVM